LTAFRLSRTILLFCLRAVPAFAQFAVFDVGFISAAVTAVPIAAANVVIVIAEAIAFKFGRTAGVFEVRDTRITLLNVGAVQTFACLAVLVIFGTATVTTIPVTTRVVIIVVAVAIAFPLR